MLFVSALKLCYFLYKIKCAIIHVFSSLSVVQDASFSHVFEKVMCLCGIQLSFFFFYYFFFYYFEILMCNLGSTL